uniref:Uncharacterized protein n=1 Tax=Timema monikensis TaxID=170555 RepID=A0A7R9EE59_9NEOP|nr:unnamed protein product [Timema monikensis]
MNLTFNPRAPPMRVLGACLTYQSTPWYSRLEMSYHHPAVTLAKLSVVGLKLAKGAYRDPLKVESLFPTCLCPKGPGFNSSTPSRDSSHDLPVIGSLVHCQSSALDHVVTETSPNTVRGQCGRNRAAWNQSFQQHNIHPRYSTPDWYFGYFSPKGNYLNGHQGLELYPHLACIQSGKPIWKNHLNTLDLDSNLNLPVIVSLVYCESSMLDHATVHPILAAREHLGDICLFVSSRQCMQHWRQISILGTFAYLSLLDSASNIGGK